MAADLTAFLLDTRDDFGQYEHRYTEAVLLNEQTRVQIGFGYETSNHNTSVVYNDFGLATARPEFQLPGLAGLKRAVQM